jgi:hypothetical protein
VFSVLADSFYDGGPPTVEEFFLPGSGAALGLTSQDLEVSRTATWEDNLATIDDIEPPGA